MRLEVPNRTGEALLAALSSFVDARGHDLLAGERYMLDSVSAPRACKAWTRPPARCMTLHRRHALSAPAVTGRVRLALQPRALEYVAARLEVVEELERLKNLSPVDFFRGCVADVYDYKRLEKIQLHLQRLRNLCVASSSRRLR